MKDLPISEVLRLPVDERLDVISAIWSTIDADRLPLSADESADLDAALDDFAAHPADVVLWEDVESRLLLDDEVNDSSKR